jgi:hypothetical protein
MGERFQVDQYNDLDEAKVIEIENSGATPDDVYVFVVVNDNRIDQNTPMVGDLSRHCIMYDGISWYDFGEFTGMKGDQGVTGIQGIAGTSDLQYYINSSMPSIINSLGTKRTDLSLGTGGFRAVAMSSDGKYIQLDKYSSIDFGVTFSQNITPLSTIYSVAMSSNGKYRIIAMYDIILKVSDDYGLTFTDKAEAKSWQSVAISSTGKYQVACHNDATVYLSSDYGVTWNTSLTGASGAEARAITISADGKYVTVVFNNNTIYVSSNYGISWASKQSSRNWVSVSMSADGKYQTAITSNVNQIFKSSDYGVTWTTSGSSAERQRIVMSADGKIRFTLQYDSPGLFHIYYSYDFGSTWQLLSTSVAKYWLGISISSDAKMLITVANASNPATAIFVSTSIIKGLVDAEGYLINGVTGIGQQGETGLRGTTGLQGETGINGLEGQTGLQGETGLQGITGLNGEIGLQGIQGETGIQGLQGTQGIQGEQGITGIKGDKWFTGTPIVNAITNGTFDSDTWWSHGGNGAIIGGQGILGAPTQFVSTSLIYRSDIAIVAGKSYTLTFDIIDANVLVYIGGGYNYEAVHTPGLGQTIIFIAGSESLNLFFYRDTPVGAKIDNVSLTYETSTDGDYYLDSINGDYYQKINDVWVLQGNLNGSAGIQGQTGVQGIQGNTGIQGIQGNTGIQGIQGQTGIQGIQGQTGIQGIQGQTGIQGIQGQTGIQGIQGQTGLRGQTGLQGIQGQQGNQGNTGLQGVQGITGFQGQTGLQGIQGQQGMTGLRGITGLQGIQGQTGLQGNTGIQGVTGSPGVRGYGEIYDWYQSQQFLPLGSAPQQITILNTAGPVASGCSINTGSGYMTLTVNGVWLIHYYAVVVAPADSIFMRCYLNDVTDNSSIMHTAGINAKTIISKSFLADISTTTTIKLYISSSSVSDQNVTVYSPIIIAHKVN